MTATLTLLPGVGSAYAFQAPGNRITSIQRSTPFLVQKYAVAGGSARADDIIRVPFPLTIEGDMSAEEVRAGGLDKVRALGAQILTATIASDLHPDAVPEVIPNLALEDFSDSQSIEQGGGRKWSLKLTQILVSAAVTVFVPPRPGKSKPAPPAEVGKISPQTPPAQARAATPQSDAQRLTAGFKAGLRLLGSQ